MPGARSRERLGVPARRLRERSWDDDAIEHHMILFKLYSPLTTLSAGPARPLCGVSYPGLRGLTSSAPYCPPRALSVPDTVSTMDELSVAR
jgi:hypothetical protein